MGIIVSENKNTIELLEPGAYFAVCRQIIDLGVQVEETNFGVKERRKVFIQWEFPDETVEIDGKEEPRRMGKQYAVSFAESAGLRKDLEAWRGRQFTTEELQGFDLDNVLGKGCQIQIEHREREGRKFANIKGIMCLPKGMKLMPPADMYSFVLEADRLDEIEAMPEWLQKKIKESLTYQKLTEEAAKGFMQPAFDEADAPFGDVF